MRVLWTSNILFPPAAQLAGEAAAVHGGWMTALADDVTKAGVELAIASVWRGRERRTVRQDGVAYYLLPGFVRSRFGYDRALQAHWAAVLDEFQPDCIHLHGSEYAFPLPLAELARERGIPTVVSIQGLVGVYERYYLAGIGLGDTLRCHALRDFFGSGALEGRALFRRRAPLERRVIQTVGHVMGRTGWDHAHALAMNPQVQYHHVDESLREPFYITQWNPETMARHTIFTGSAAYPIKGLHLLLPAVALLARRYPGVRLRVAGACPWAGGRARTGYGRYLQRMVRALGLGDAVTFTSPLTAAAMAGEMAAAHVFVLPSAIENSPNTLGEAQLVGTPCVAAYVGGVPDMVTDGVDGLLYNWQEPAVLAAKVSSVFEDDALAQRLSAAGRGRAAARHDRARNLQAVLACYTELAARGNPQFDSV